MIKQELKDPKVQVAAIGLAALILGGIALALAAAFWLGALASGEAGMTTASALSGYTFGFWALLGAGAVLFLLAPLIQKLMHGVK